MMAIGILVLLSLIAIDVLLSYIDFLFRHGLPLYFLYTEACPHCLS